MYLDEYPNSASADKAKSRIAGILDEAFERAKGADMKKTYREFLSLKPTRDKATEA
jgi:hypothetical protein